MFDIGIPAGLASSLHLAGPIPAYIGPGAGLAIGGSVLSVLLALASALLILLTWPARVLVHRLLGTRRSGPAQAKRVVILGLDGLDFELAKKLMDEGRLPNMTALRDRGCFKRLGTTLPSISPVAWSSFQTGTNPGKHNIYDFLIPDRQTYKPKLSSVEIRPARRYIRIGKYRIPLSRGDIRMLRKSRPFWHYLGDSGVTSSIIRVPITFPPEKLRGVLLSAMCTPDLRGTQGMFAYYTTRQHVEGERIGGDVHHVSLRRACIRARLRGPLNPFIEDGSALFVPFAIKFKGKHATLSIQGIARELRRDEYTEWIRIRFWAAPGFAIYGTCRFLLREIAPEFGLYVSPINIDPQCPVMPISSPPVYANYLTKRQGSFATLGLAEDTWAVNSHILDDGNFLHQCLEADRERELMFFDALEKTPRGLCVVVFDGTDRMQHMFWRDLDPSHPSRSLHPVPEGRNLIHDLYRRMDDLVGRTMTKCRETGTVVMVISDHGFTGFRRGIDLNRWLEENGYLSYYEGRRSEECLSGVDWARSRAFAIGLSGVFLNLRGKFSRGIVEPGVEAERLLEEIAEGLNDLVDPISGAKVIRRTYFAAKVYNGPYIDQAPDLIPGYERGYRVAWDTAIGRGTDAVFHDNTKAWSGDHCADPSLIPGVLFCSHPIKSSVCHLKDIGPTVLSLFGVKVPEHMDGKPLLIEGLGIGETMAAGVHLSVKD